MNYDHAFHIGNHADILKHALLAAILKRLVQKPKPLTLMDFFAGSGHYDLLLDERTQRGREWQQAAAPVWQRGENNALSALFQAWKAINSGKELRYYPGSPLIMSHFLRKEDKLFCVEAKKAATEALTQALLPVRQARIYETDGWQALESFLPPTPRRGLALIDPPFEQTNEFERMLRAAQSFKNRWASGILVLWWPVKERDFCVQFEQNLAVKTAPIPLLRVQLTLPTASTGLKTSTLAIFNPPYQFDQDARDICVALAKTLQTQTDITWLTPAL